MVMALELHPVLSVWDELRENKAPEPDVVYVCVAALKLMKDVAVVATANDADEMSVPRPSADATYRLPDTLTMVYC